MVPSSPMRRAVPSSPAHAYESVSISSVDLAKSIFFTFFHSVGDTSGHSTALPCTTKVFDQVKRACQPQAQPPPSPMRSSINSQSSTTSSANAVDARAFEPAEKQMNLLLLNIVEEIKEDEIKQAITRIRQRFQQAKSTA
jgi:hypothetical protein